VCNHSRQDDAASQEQVLLPGEPVAPLLQPTSAETLALCPTPDATKLAQKQDLKQKPLTQMYLDFGQVPRTTLVLLTVIRTAIMVIAETPARVIITELSKLPAHRDPGVKRIRTFQGRRTWKFDQNLVPPLPPHTSLTREQAWQSAKIEPASCSLDACTSRS